MSEIRRWPFPVTHPSFSLCFRRVPSFTVQSCCLFRKIRQGGREGGREGERQILECESGVKDGTRLQLASLFTVSLSVLLVLCALLPPPSSLSFYLSLSLSLS